MKTLASVAFFENAKTNESMTDDLCLFYSNVRVGGPMWSDGEAREAQKQIERDFTRDAFEYCPDLPNVWIPKVIWLVVEEA